MSEIWAQEDWVKQSKRIIQSYKNWVGNDLVNNLSGNDLEQAKQLFFADKVVVSHDTSEDPLINYGNEKTLNLWEAKADDLIGMPSRKTAEPMHRDERAKMLEQTSKTGFFQDYKGVRITSKGRRFFIHKATIWNLLDEDGLPAGQAATFSDWTFLNNQ